MKQQLIEEIGYEFSEINETKVGSVERKEAILGLATLIKTHNEIEEREIERQKQVDQQKLEDLKLEQMKQEREERLDLQKVQLQQQKDQNLLLVKQNKRATILGWAQLLLTTGISIGGIALTVWGSKYTMKYEDEGIIPSTQAGKEHTRHLYDKR